MQFECDDKIIYYFFHSEHRFGDQADFYINVERLMHSFPVLMVVCGMRSNMDHLDYGNILSES